MTNITELDEANNFLFKQGNLNRLIDWSIGDIRKCYRGGSFVGAFILWVCAIEYFGGLYTNKKETLGRIKGFVTNFMKGYEYRKLYDLRNSLTHNYSPKHYLLLAFEDLGKHKELHNTPNNGGTILHLGCAIEDLEKAVNSYKAKLELSNQLKLNAIRYFKKHYPIVPVKTYVTFKTMLQESSITSSLATSATMQSVQASGTVPYHIWIGNKL